MKRQNGLGAETLYASADGAMVDYPNASYCIVCKALGELFGSKKSK